MAEWGAVVVSLGVFEFEHNLIAYFCIFCIFLKIYVSFSFLNA